MTTLREKVRLLIERDTLQPADSGLLDAIYGLIEQERLQARLELAEELAESRLAEPAHTYASENADLYRGFDNGVFRCIEFLRSAARR